MTNKNISFFVFSFLGVCFCYAKDYNRIYNQDNFSDVKNVDFFVYWTTSSSMSFDHKYISGEKVNEISISSPIFIEKEPVVGLEALFENLEAFDEPWKDLWARKLNSQMLVHTSNSKSYVLSIYDKGEVFEFVKLQRIRLAEDLVIYLDNEVETEYFHCRSLDAYKKLAPLLPTLFYYRDRHEKSE